MSPSDAEAVKRLFASVASPADAEKEASKRRPNGDLPLHYVAWCAKGQHAIEVFATIFNAYPSAAKERGSSGQWPLHDVARYMGMVEGGLQAMQLLLAEYPEAAGQRSSDKWLPIHYICWNETGTDCLSLEMVIVLLSAYPEGINEKDPEGRKPYEIASTFGHLPADATEFLRRAENGEQQ